MILVDTSIWVGHLRASDSVLTTFLKGGQILGHPFVTGELALGNLRQHDRVVSALQDLPQATVATDTEVLQFIRRHALYGRGIGYVDAHLLASVALTGGARLWTRDQRLEAAAEKLGLATVLPD